MKKSRNGILLRASPIAAVTPGGSAASSAGIASRTASATSTRLDFDWRTSETPTAGRPLNRKKLRSSSAPSSTLAMSPSLTTCEFVVATTMLANSSAFLSSPNERTENSRRSDSIRPAGISTLRAWMARTTSCTVRL